MNFERLTRALRAASTMSRQQQDLFDRDPAPWELDEQTDRAAASIVFAEAPYGPFDYLVPDDLRDAVEPGRRVRVPLGRQNRAVVGYCIGVEQCAATTRKLKVVKSVVDKSPLLSPALLRLTQWMAENYLCERGQAVEAVVPKGVRIQAGTREAIVYSVPTHVVAKLTQLDLPPKQAAVLRLLAGSRQSLTAAQLAKAAQVTTGPINALEKKGLIRAETRRIDQSTHDLAPERREDHLQMNADQQAALDIITGALHAPRHETILIHGITGSGKTEIYIRAIDEVIGFGRQAIVLVPEISLTPQTQQRFCSRFDRVAVLHSHLTAAERNWHWRRIARGEIQVVVGARSAIFAPTPHLGLIVLDEEHDGSFKQDNVPRYHARDVALYRARMEGVPLVLGSATPSLESWQQALDGKYQLVRLPRRVYNRPLPDVVAIDLRTEFQQRGSRGAVSRPLHLAIRRALDDDGQVILLLNRRGFATSIQCPACGHVARCPNCDIALTHHRAAAKALCHYCEFEIAAPTDCAECNFVGIRYAGLGTQKLEAEVQSRFSGVSCLRMDSDTMQKPGSHEEALARFRSGEVRILLGTQMIAKGLDFPNVTLVGVINADTALHFPDFRAAERTFQLVTQVAGRTGRGDKGGRVLVQTLSPEHPAIVAAMTHDYELFARQELPVRSQYGYPPLASMVRIVVRGQSRERTEQFAQHIADRLAAGRAPTQPDVRVLGPAEAPIAKLRGKFRFHLLLQCADGAALRKLVRDTTAELKTPDDVQWIVDVDPLDML